jgi:hypothetical protein
MSHYDLGEIRTEEAVSPTPPEKKERLGIWGSKKRLGYSKAPPLYIFVVKFLLKPYKFFRKKFFKLRICASKLNIYFDGTLCQVQGGMVAQSSFLSVIT